MDITSFAERVKAQGFIERHDAEQLKVLAEACIAIAELAEDVHLSATPVYTKDDEVHPVSLLETVCVTAKALNGG